MGVFSPARRSRRVSLLVATVSLLAGMLALSGTAAAKAASVSVSSSISGSTATIEVTVAHKPKASIATCSYELDGSAPNACGTPSSSAKKSTSYSLSLTNLDGGIHTLSVSAAFTDGEGATGITTFEVAPCNVTNQTTAVQYAGTGPNLQAAIDAAQSGDTIEIQGLCLGNYVIATATLTLIGTPTNGQSMAELDGNASGSVLEVGRGAGATLTDLLITNGNADRGGGIFNLDGVVLLNGSTMVSGNVAGSGGGIHNQGGFPTVGGLTLDDSSSVTGNIADSGGGIWNSDTSTVVVNDATQVNGNMALGCAGIQNLGSVTLNDSSQVNGNVAASVGGGICSLTQVTLNDNAQVAGNLAGTGTPTGERFGYAGGVLNAGTITLNDASSITGNTAATVGGGIYNECIGTIVLNGGSVSGNTPDDVAEQCAPVSLNQS